ncbi:ribosomal RNA adenine dimethylase domain protein [Lachnospiraceae bacterium KM106-2]|nr:ribosomal RNA adenine dimethylase domain protein [Lachnospiraceae bacterium KM106-2]
MLQFIKQYIKHPSKVGAVAPSSRYLAEQMMETINFNRCQCIVEYGAGTGVFTKEIIKRKKEDTLFLVIEENEVFYRELLQQFGEYENVRIIHGKAEQVDQYLKQYDQSKADYIVSGIPFASLPKVVSNQILRKTETVLGGKGVFITFQYTMFKKKLFERYFTVRRYKKVYRNVPPANVLVMKNKEGILC